MSGKSGKGVFILVRLEYFSKKDFQQLIDWMPDASFVLQWSGPTFSYPLTNGQLEKYMEGANKPDATTYIFKVMDDTINEVIGHVSLGKVDRNNSSARIGKVLVGAADSRGKDYGSQIIHAALAFAFEELKLYKVNLGVFDFNMLAIKCYEAAGFRRERSIKDAAKIGDEYWTLIEMGILYNDWENRIS